MTGFRFRPARADDVAALRAIARAAFAMYVPRMGREPAPMTADYAHAVARDEVWVAADDTELLGMLVLRRGEADLLLETVAVLPSAQGRGIGLALIRLAECRAAELGLPAVALYTHETMIENQRLYSRLGYTEVDRRTDHGYRRIHYRKPGLHGSQRPPHHEAAPLDPDDLGDRRSG